MPGQTFKNLNPDRQQEIIRICMREFALKDYREVNLTEIIKKLGLAKGSFYRYFSGKRDLYEYLIESALDMNKNIFKKIFASPVDDIIDAWVRFYLAAALLDNADPVIGWFGFKIFRERNNLVLGNVALESKRKGIQVLERLFREQQEKGRLRKDLSPELMIFVLLQIQEGFMDYLEIKYGFDFQDNVIHARPLFPLPEETLRLELESFAAIIRYGIAAAPGGKRDI